MRFNVDIVDVKTEKNIYAVYFQGTFLCFIEYHVPLNEESYSIIINNTLTPITKTYRNRFKWFTEFGSFLELIGGNIKDAYFNIGNYSLIGKEPVYLGYELNVNPQENTLKPDVQAMIRFYRNIYPLLEKHIGDVFVKTKEIL